MNSWVSYLFSGMMAVVLSWAMTGCRFGNRTEDAPPPGPADGLSGLYETEPSSVRLCARYSPPAAPSDPAKDVCQEFAPSEVSYDYDAIMSQPVIFQRKDGTNDTGYFASPYVDLNTAPYFKVTYDSKYNFVLSQNANNIWDPATDTSPGCTDVFWRDGRGQLSPAGPVKKVFGSSKVTILGRVTLTLSESDVFFGECAPALQYISSCLKDSSSCGSAQDLATAQAVFGPYLEKVMTVDDVATAQALEMTVIYR